ncbi:MAG TPA: cytochrome c oxidase subunit II [Cytophagaceae bacterium]|jgi:cytochrome c oxidase subunit 2
MTEIVLGVAAVLILVILLLIFRIQTLLGVMKGSSNKQVGTSNKINALMFVIFLAVGLVAFFWYSSVARDSYLPTAVSDHGIRVDRMFWVTMAILVFAFIVTNIFLFWFAYKYQHKEGRKAYFYPDNHKLEIIWTVIPAIVMAILVYYGWKEWSLITQKEPEGSEVIEVMGKQFAWQVRYPGKDGELGKYDFRLIDATNEFGMDFTDKASIDDFTPSELHVPKGKPVLLRIRARDVLHSVFMPHFRLKMDAVPGMPTKFWFVPNKTTQEMRDELGNPNFNYELACTEICGRGHFAMRFIVVVDEPEEYEAWSKSQKSFAEVNSEYAEAKTPAGLKHLLNAPKVDNVNTPGTGPVPNPGDTTKVDIDSTKSDNLHAANTK